VQVTKAFQIQGDQLDLEQILESLESERPDYELGMQLVGAKQAEETKV
jgi:hypothetical protein